MWRYEPIDCEFLNTCHLHIKLTRVVFGQLGSPQLEPRYRERSDQVVESRPFVIQDLLLGVFGKALEMVQSTPLMFVSMCMGWASGVRLTKYSNGKDQEQINEEKLPQL
jgi:hypothetical protein